MALTTEENNSSIQAESFIYNCELTTSKNCDFLVRSLYKSYLKFVLSANRRN